MNCAIYKMKKSFTLIELLIVIVIIGVIITFEIPQYRKAAIRARGAEAKHNLNMLAESLWRYYLETGHFPRTQSELPGCLDVTLPDETSGYFTYRYFCSSVPSAPLFGLVVYAYDADAYSNGPVGAIIRYSIRIEDESPFWGQTGQRLDDNLYKYYLHTIKETTSTPEKPGWP